VSDVRGRTGRLRVVPVFEDFFDLTSRAVMRCSSAILLVICVFCHAHLRGISDMKQQQAKTSALGTQSTRVNNKLGDVLKL